MDDLVLAGRRKEGRARGVTSVVIRVKSAPLDKDLCSLALRPVDY